MADNVQTNKNLKNTIELDDGFYNINAVEADVAKKTKASLTLNKSLESGITTETFNGNLDKSINYVPSDGGKFTGPVWVYKDNTSVAGIDNNEIINKGQIETTISRLRGAPLWTWDAASKKLTAVENASEIPYKLNTVVGKTADLQALVARDTDSKNDEYLQEENENGNNIDGHVTYSNDGVATGLKTGDNATDIAILGTYKGPTDYVKIGAQAFKDKTQLNWVHINPGAKEIGESAFAGCTNLSYVAIPDSVKEIGASAFENCPYLNTVDLSRRITEIKSKTFAIDYNLVPKELIQYGNYGLTSITIGCGVTKIASDAFYGCDNITNIYFNGTEADWNNIKDEDGNSNPLAILATQVDATVHFGNIVPFPFLYICNDGESDTSLTSNKMFLKMPGKDLIEVSKGAARLERPSANPNSDSNYKYYTYDTLAAVIAGINSRLTALGSTALALPEELKISDTIHVAVPEISDDIISADEYKSILVEETVVPTVQVLQKQLTSITGNTPEKEEEVLQITPALQAKADSTGREIKTGYYQSRNNRPANIAESDIINTANTINTITILNRLPYDPEDSSKILAGNIGDICIVIKKA